MIVGVWSFSGRREATIRHQYAERMPLRVARGRIAIVATAIAVTVGLIPTVADSTISTSTAATVTKVTIPEKSGFAPHPPPGATDQYRCTFFDPHFTSDRMEVSSWFHNGTKEVHHAIAYLVAPSMVPKVKALDPLNHGWPCFASPLGATSMGNLNSLPWIAGWSPGHGRDTVPPGYGVAIAAGSGVILQIHYNALVGRKPDRSYLDLSTVPADGSPLVALNAQQYVAAPDLPCPVGVSGPLCDHAASLADLGQRFGVQAENFTKTLETICNHGMFPTDPTSPLAASATCTLPIGANETIHRITPHMHMLGRTFTVAICHRDPSCAAATTTQLLYVASYNFDNQVAYNLPRTVVGPGDFLKVTCTYDPALRRFNPTTRKLPPRYITWGDGSSDEMCLATIWASHGNS